MGEKKAKRGLGGLTPEKKKLLKQLIMQKAAEDLKKKQAEEAAAKKKIIDGRVPPLDVGGLSQDQLEKKVKELYNRYVRLEEEKYDIEIRMAQQDQQVNELTIKVNDIKGKFVKPVLKKVSKTESKLAKFEKKSLKSKLGFRDQLKSTGQSKYALEEEDKGAAKKPDWGQDALHKAADHEEKEEEEGGEGEEEEEEEEEEE